LAFDFPCFIVGLLAGALVGVLAGYLHETETIGELQERVRIAMLQFERLASRSSHEPDNETVREQVRKQLMEIQDEIRKMYRRPEG